MVYHKAANRISRYYYPARQQLLDNAIATRHSHECYSEQISRENVVTTLWVVKRHQDQDQSRPAVYLKN